MNATALQGALQQAIRDGLLPAGASVPTQDTRPWPVVLLIALGAWLAALPLLAVVGLLLGDFIRLGIGAYFVGGLLLVGAVVVLRSQSLPVFVEQLALPALLVGGGSIAAGLFRDLDRGGAATLMSLVSVAVAVAVPRPWLRVLLGAAAGSLFGLACTPHGLGGGLLDNQARLGLALHGMLALWALAGAAQSRAGPQVRAALEPLRAGWLLATLAGLASWSGMTMLAGASLGGGAAGNLARMPWPLWRAQSLPLQGLSLLLALAAAAWAARQWPPLRRPWCAGAALVLAALAACMPALGATLLALAATATGARWRLAGASALAAAWIVGAFYYALSWPLQSKALMLVAAGALLGALAWWALRPQRAVSGGKAALPASSAQRAPSPLAVQPAPLASAASQRAGLLLSVAAVLALANGGIWQKERLIAQGQPVFVELAPVDPRSLMQGDYMQLRFALPDAAAITGLPMLWAERAHVLARRDERGVVKLRLPEAGVPTPAGELMIELTPKAGRWVLVTDAWYFAEGQGARWAAAKYGEFRVDAQGRALLVGLRGPQLEPL